MNASPEVKVRVSKGIERGPVGNLVKKTNGFKCQVCEALGRNAESTRDRVLEARRPKGPRQGYHPLNSQSAAPRDDEPSSHPKQARVRSRSRPRADSLGAGKAGVLIEGKLAQRFVHSQQGLVANVEEGELKQHERYRAIDQVSGGIDGSRIEALRHDDQAVRRATAPLKGPPIGSGKTSSRLSLRLACAKLSTSSQVNRECGQHSR